MGVASASRISQFFSPQLDLRILNTLKLIFFLRRILVFSFLTAKFFPSTALGVNILKVLSIERYQGLRYLVSQCAINFDDSLPIAIVSTTRHLCGIMQRFQDILCRITNAISGA